MKNASLLILTILAFIPSASHIAYAQGKKGLQDPMNYYASTRVGDTVDVPYCDTVEILFFAFTQPTACHTCMLSLEPIRRNLAAYGRVKMTLYVSTGDQKVVDEMRKDRGWSFDIEIDPIRAYQKSFGVKKPPVGIATNRSGVVLAVGPIGSSTYDWGNIQLNTGFTLASQQPTTPTLTSLRRTELLGSEDLVSAGLQRQIVFLNDSVLAVNATPLRRTAVYGLDGTRQHLINITPDTGYIPFAPMLSGTPNRSQRIVYFDIDPTTNKPVVFLTDLDGSLRKFYSPNVEHRIEAQFGFFTATDSANQILVTSVVYLDSITRGNDKSGAIAWSPIDGSVSARIERDSLFATADLSNYYWVAPWIDAHEIACIANLSTKVAVISRTREQAARTLPFEPDTNVWKTAWRVHYSNLKSSSTLEERKALGSHTSKLDRLLKDTETGHYYVSFYNTLDNGSIDMYITGPLGLSTNSTQYVGRDHLCHKVQNELLYTSSSDNGRLFLCIKKLPF